MSQQKWRFIESLQHLTLANATVVVNDPIPICIGKLQEQINNRQPLDSTLTALAAYNSNGFLVQTAQDSFAGRSITTSGNGISVTNGNGVSGNPNISLNAMLASLSQYNTNGILTQTSANTFVGRSVVAGAGITVTNGNGVSGNPTIAITDTGVSAGSYGSSSQIPTYTVNARGQLTAASNVTVDKLYDHWHHTTQYNASQLRRYTNTGTTDGNGRVTFHMTTTGASGGPALFSSVFHVSATGVDGSGTAIQGPWGVVQSVTNTTLVVRFLKGRSQGVLLGGIIVIPEWCGSGYTVSVEVVGHKS